MEKRSNHSKMENDQMIKRITAERPESDKNKVVLKK